MQYSFFFFDTHTTQNIIVSAFFIKGCSSITLFLRPALVVSETQKKKKSIHCIFFFKKKKKLLFSFFQ